MHGAAKITKRAVFTISVRTEMFYLLKIPCNNFKLYFALFVLVAGLLSKEHPVSCRCYISWRYQFDGLPHRPTLSFRCLSKFLDQRWFVW